MAEKPGHPFDRFFSPRSIAVVGASSTPGKIGHEIVRNMSQYDFRGEVYPITLTAEKILGLRCYRSIKEVPGEVDLAVYALPAPAIPGLIEEAGMKGVRNAIIISGGFKEAGEEGASRQRQLVEAARRHGIRVIGPNCIGVFDGETRLDTFFYPHERMRRPPKGGISFITQSGTFGCVFLEWAANSSLGVRRLVSLGNKVDVDETELIEYLAADTVTKVIAVHLESVTDGRRLVEVAREASRRKPVVALKGGRTAEGYKAVVSHTGSLAGSYDVCLSAFREAGMIVAESFEELFDKAKALERQGVARGSSLAFLTNAAGPSVTAIDIAHERGFAVGRYAPETQAKLRSSLPSYAIVGQAIDLTGSATSEDFRKALSLMLEDPQTDMLLVFVVFVNSTLEPEVVDVIADVSGRGKPVLCWATGSDYSEDLIRKLEKRGVPTYPTSERLMNAVSALIEAGRPAERAPPPAALEADREAAARVFRKAQAEGREMLTELEAKEVLRAYGIQTTAPRLATTASEAASYASQIGFPVVLKVVSAQIAHKSDVGGVITDVETPAQAAEGFETIMRRARQMRPDAQVEGVLVEEQLPAGVEVLVGSIRDAQFGPVMVFGMGGVLTEAFRDVAFGLAQLSERKALDMIARTRAARLLAGTRGGAPVDLGKLAELMVRASFLAVEQPIAEMDLNPVIASAAGSAAADARIRMMAVS
ncbi:MAG: acetate--CoA ligase family protein [Candidatus Bathyarchaeia archaeon]